MSVFPGSSNTSASNSDCMPHKKATTQEELWDLLKEHIEILFKNKTCKKRNDLSLLHWYCYDYIDCILLSQKMLPTTTTEECQNRLEEICSIRANMYKNLETFLRDYLQKLILSAADLKEEAIVEFYTNNWEHYRHSSKILEWATRNLKNTYIKKQREETRKLVHGIYRLAIIAWIEIIFEKLKSKVKTAMLKLILNERSENITSPIIQRAIKSFLDLDFEENQIQSITNGLVNENRVTDNNCRYKSLEIYKTYFEIPFFNETANYYSNESERLLKVSSAKEYLKRASKLLLVERQRITILPHTAGDKLLKTSESACMTNYFQQLLRQEFICLLQNEDAEEMSQMYKLAVEMQDALYIMKDTLEGHICDEGLSAIRMLDEKNLMHDPELYVDTIMQVHGRFSELILKAFGTDPGFVTALDKACWTFINSNDVENNITAQKSSELLSQTCHLLLKESSNKPKDIERRINSVITVFKYLKDKGFFGEKYSQMLATRLVAQTSFSDEAELMMIDKLQEICGFTYTYKMRRALKDICLSKQLNKEFKEWTVQKGDFLPFDFQLQILTTAYWPFNNYGGEFLLPSELAQSVNKFTGFYNGKHSGKKLTWIFNRSKGEIEANCFKKPYIFYASTFQMAILLMFNSRDAYNIGELSAATNLKMDVLIRVLETLLKKKLLLLPNNERLDEVKDVTTICLFKDYKNAKRRVNINIPIAITKK